MFKKFGKVLVPKYNADIWVPKVVGYYLATVTSMYGAVEDPRLEVFVEPNECPPIQGYGEFIQKDCIPIPEGATRAQIEAIKSLLLHN